MMSLGIFDNRRREIFIHNLNQFRDSVEEILDIKVIKETCDLDC